MMPSTEKEYKEQIKQERLRGDSMWNAGLNKAVGVINRCEFLTEEEKNELLWELKK